MIKRYAAWLCALGVCGVILGISAGEIYAADSTTAPAAISDHVNTAVVPKLNPGFMRRHDSFVEIAKKGDIDLLFMGDSITDWWRSDGSQFARLRQAATTRSAGAAATQPAAGGRPQFLQVPGAYTGKPVFDKYFSSMKVANFGIAGDTTQGVLWRLQNGEGQGYSPKAIMLMIGTNNMGRNTPEEIAEGNAAVVAELRKDFPDAKILLLGIFPRGAKPTDPFRAKIKEANETIAKLNDDQHVFYMDIGDKFLNPDGSLPPEIMSDGLHPTTKGYEIWAQAVIDKLKGFLS
ncbi:MAG TPA: GDSL-type esterase/lipase family protein [Tepidisphaeraceae bacterium]|jgi:lysophospholipase L1-like esterase|nr:GDSL-type esterase/lipase family protein [Tepidisphaeraceae bacterium]